MQIKKQKKIIALALFINVIVIMLFLPMGCPWKERFGIDCAGCGTTRMLKSILNLEIYQAFRYNPLMFILFALLLLYGIYYLICKIIKKKPLIPNKKGLIIMSIILLIVLILFTILRNLSMFEFLRPTIIN